MCFLLLYLTLPRQLTESRLMTAVHLLARVRLHWCSVQIDGCSGCPVASNVSWSIFRKSFDACTAKTGRYMVESVES